MVRIYNNGKDIVINEGNWLESTIDHLENYAGMLRSEIGSTEEEEMIERVEALIEYLENWGKEADEDEA